MGGNWTVTFIASVQEVGCQDMLTEHQHSIDAFKEGQDITQKLHCIFANINLQRAVVKHIDLVLNGFALLI